MLADTLLADTDDNKGEDVDDKEEEGIDNKEEDVNGNKEEDVDDNKEENKDTIDNMPPKLKQVAATPPKNTVKKSSEWRNLPMLSPRS